MLILPLSTPSSGGLPPGVTSPGDGALNYVTGALTASRPSINVAQTWNNAAVPFDADLMDITDTASAAGSTLLNRRLNGANRLNLRKDGRLTIAGGFFPTDGLGSFNGLSLILGSDAAHILMGASGDVSVRRDGPNIANQRNAGAAQTYRLERTYTDGSNRGYTDFAQDATGGLRINSVWTGGVAAPTNLLDVQGNGTSFLRVTANGQVWANSNTLITSPTVFMTNGYLIWPTVGVLSLQDNGGNAINRLAFGPANSSHPALMRNGASLDVRLADDSGFSDLRLRMLTAVGGTVTASTPVMDLSQTWNNPSVAFTGVNLFFTNTASSGASRAIRLGSSTGGANCFSVSVDGSMFCTGGASNGTFSVAGNLDINAGTSLTWNGGDLNVRRGGPNTLAQRNGLNPQAYELFNRYTAPSVFERGFVRWASDILEIGTDAAGGGSFRNIRLTPGGGFVLFGNNFMGIQARTLRISNSGKIAFTSLIDNMSAGFDDAAIERSSVGAVEVNNGTLGQFRDFKVRDLYLGAAAVSGTITPTHTMTIYANGVAYRVPCVAA